MILQSSSIFNCIVLVNGAVIDCIKIEYIRGHRVILDVDIAELYEVQNKVLNQAVKRNSRRFPKDFAFKLTQEEFEILKSQTVTSRWGGNRKLPTAFTEHGVTMLASVLNSTSAITMSIAIVRAFVIIKKTILDFSSITEQIELLKTRMGEHDDQLQSIYDTIENLLDQKIEVQKWEERERIGFLKL